METPGTIDGGELLVRGLEAEGVQAIFAIADVSYTPIFRSAEAHGMRIVGARHESANVHMADGWARVTGGIAVAMAGLGPGVANLVPGVITAWIEGIPVLVIATQRTDRAHRAIRRGRFQYTPQIDVFRPVTKFAGAVPDARRIPEYVREAFRCALSGRPGPAYLEVADEVLRQKVDEAKVQGGVEPARYRAAPGAPDRAQLDAAAALLADAAFPLVLAGSGVLRAGAWEELRALVEQTGALLLTTHGARGALPEDHPQVVMFMTPGGAQATREADLVLAVGTQVGEMMGYGRPPRWGAPAAQRWIQLDADPASIGVNREVDLALVGDARAGLGALLAALRARGPARMPGARLRECVAACRQAREAVESLARTDTFPIHPARLAREVASFFPRGAIACFDGGNTTVWAHLFHRFATPRSLLWTSHFGHLGTGLPYAIGAKLACPDRPVYLFTGDSAFGFNLQELETAARERANIVVVINCDFAWGMEHLGQMLEMGKTIGVVTSPVRYDEVARALGCHGERVERAEEIRPALERAAASGKPAVVQVLVDAAENVSPPGLLEFAQMYAALDA